MAEKIPLTLDMLSKGERKQVQAVKTEVLSLAKAYGVAREKIEKIAPKVIALWRTLEPRLGKFVVFARFLDPSVPMNAKTVDGEIGYLAHRTYYTLDYMRRKVRQAEAPPQDANARQGRTNPATDQLARVLASVLSVKGIDPETVWAAVSQEFGIAADSRGMKRLKARVDETKPLIDLHTATVKGPAKVIPMRQATPSAATVMESLNRANAAVGGRNRRVRVSA